MRLLKNLILTFLCLSFIPSHAQNDIPIHTVHVGNFVNPEPADFESISALGFVYAKKQPDGLIAVMMGGYSSETEAKKVAAEIQSKGFNPHSTKLNLEAGETATVIQLGWKKAGKKFDWESYLQLDRLYVILNDDKVKIVTGIYDDMAAAKAQLPGIRKMGFDDAFAKNVNTALLHEVTEFETGGEKRPLIPLVFRDDSERKPQPTGVSTEIPEPYDMPTKKIETKTMTTKGAPAVFEPSFTARVPHIRVKVKRNSAYELQKVLKEEGVYKSSLDGYYGKGTKAAYEKVKNSNRQLKKYRVLAQHAQQSAGVAQPEELQYAINHLWDDSAVALQGLEASDDPVAKAYLAYYMFVKDGKGERVNELMNAAVNQAFADAKPTDTPRFDYNSTYLYEDLDQLLLHLRFVQEVSKNRPTVPCWLFRKHPLPAMRAFDCRIGSSFHMESCGGFWEWEEIRILHEVAKDLDMRRTFDSNKRTEAISTLHRHFLAPGPVKPADQKALESWNKKLWKGIDGWNFRDPLLDEMSKALKIVYFQSYVLLEDHFMDEGFDKNEAKGIALAILKALVGYHLDRFV